MKKNRFFTAGVLALLLALGLVLAGCDTGDDGGGNTGGNTGGNNPGGYSTVPSTPTGVTASRNPAGSATVTVSWNAVSGATSYRVYYSTTGSDSGSLDGTSSTTSYDSTGNGITSTWYFRVSAVNSEGEGSPSSWVSVGPVSGGGGGTTAPSAPTGVTATALSSSSISVSWNSVSGATSYDVYYEIGSSLTKNFASNTTSTSYTHTGLTASTTYYYYIKAKNSAGDSAYSSFDSATTSSSSGGGGGTSSPGTPTNVSATAQSSSSIRISWSAPSSGGTPTYYNIWRSTSAGGTYTEIGYVSGSTLSYTNTGLSASTTYYYKVDAQNNTGRSSQSSYVSATTQSSGGGGTTLPNPPYSVGVQERTSNSLTIYWGSSLGATGYKLYYATSESGPFVVIYTGSNTSYRHTGLSRSTTYYYKVTATNSAGESGFNTSGVFSTYTTN